MDVKERLIVQKLRNGEQDAYRYLYDRHYVLLCQFANELVGDPFLAETIVGDVIFHLWEIRETLDINSSLRAYLCGTAVITISHQKRKRRKFVSRRLSLRP